MGNAGAGRRAAGFGAVLAALPAFAAAFLVRVRAWPEIAAPAWFMTRGEVLYDAIFFPHTPLLISALAALGSVLGFSALVFRVILGAALAATAALIVIGLERERGRGIAAAAGVLVSLLWSAYMDGLGVFPDPLLSPLLLGAGLALERHDRNGSRTALRGGGLLLGAAILVKQTSAWVALAAILWAVLRRKRAREVVELAAAAALPYLVFAGLWAAAFRTTSHVYWTLVVPLFSSHAGEIRAGGGWDDVHQAIGPFLVLPALFLLERASGRRMSTAIPLLALGVVGMAWPRGGLLHLSAAVGLLSFLTARAGLRIVALFAAWRRTGLPRTRLAAAVAGVWLLVSGLGVAAFSGGGVLSDESGGEVFYWNDTFTDGLAREVSARVPPGDAVFLFNTRRDNLYARTGTVAPGGLYVNSSFWFYFNKDAVGPRVIASLKDFPGWILFREPDPGETELRGTELYRFLAERTVVVEAAPDGMTWRKIRPE